ASRAANSPPCAAHAGCIGFVGVASSRYAKRPPANEPAIPSALAVDGASTPASRDAAVAAPKMPQLAVGWDPRAGEAPDAGIPTLVTPSLPPTIAVSPSRPLAPFASPAAIDAGVTTTLTWATESECVSSKSSPWQTIAFANAAFAAGRAASSPITDACGS